MKKFSTQHAIKWLLFSGLVLLFGVLALTGCSGLSLTTNAAAEPAPTLPAVQADPFVIAEGHIVPRDSATLAFLTSGEVKEILATEGQQVSKGDVLARLGDTETAQAAVTAAELEKLNAQQALDDLNKKSALASSQAELNLRTAEKAVIDAQQKFDELDTDEFQNQLDDLWVAVTDAKTELDDAQTEMDKYLDLDKDNPTRKKAEDDLKAAQKKYDDALREHDLKKNSLDQARADLAMAQATLEDAKREAESRKNGPDPDELALAQSRLKNADAQLAAANSALDQMELKAPYDGTVLDVKVSAGEQVVPSQPVIVFADLSQWYVETSDLTELDVVRIDPAKEVTVTPDALPDLHLDGTVESIGKTFTEKGADITYKVRILLKDSDPRLRWGMTVEVKFQQ